MLENTVSGNAIGLNIAGTGTTVRGNEIRDNSVGVVISFIEGGTSPELVDNTIEGSARGISISAGASPTLTRNVVCDNETNVHIVEGALPTLEDNEICPDGVSDGAG